MGKGEGERGVGGRGKGGKKRGGGEEREGKGEMGVDLTKFWKKLMPLFIGIYSFEYKNNRPIASCLQRVKLP